ncbi:MAG: carboxylate-amine ligase [Gemmatimonadetes bacterium]|nr:carboxylate-amine ligase [Gemmatimonadota bacterium]
MSAFPPGSPYGPLGSHEELEEFERLKRQLPDTARSILHEPGFEHTTVVVPSISVNQEELRKIKGASFYEERLLFTLIRLANPAARLVYVTSQPIHPDILEYYLQHLPGVPMRHALRRLLVLRLYDASPRPLTEKVLERPRVIRRIRDWIGPPERAYLSVFNSTALERRLAVELGIPLNAVDPALLWLGTKSGSRRVFEEAGVDLPAGRSGVQSEDEVIHALSRLASDRPGLRQAIVKLNDSFAGEGNAIFRFPDPLPEAPLERSAALRTALHAMALAGQGETHREFLRKLGEMGGVVEERIEGTEFHSPSVQLRIHPDGELALVSTHDQVLGGESAQAYVGCRFPAADGYRDLIQDAGLRIGEVLARKGVLGRFGIDFVLSRDPGTPWRAHAIEINLRMGGTTPPFMALEFLTGGRLDRGTGLYHTLNGTPKYYTATDNLRSPAYRGLLPEDLMELLVSHGLHFKHSTGTGVLFYMIGALSQYGKLGLTSIGNSRAEADEMYRTTVAILDRETGADSSDLDVPTSLFTVTASTRME